MAAATPLIANAIFDAALELVNDCTEVNVYDGSVMVKDGITLDASNYGAIGDFASGGRQVQCLVSDGSDMLNIGSLSAGGTIDKVVLLRSIGSVMTAQITAGVSDVVVGASDAINLGTFYVRFLDPT